MLVMRLRKRGALAQKYPIKHGILTNWDEMVKTWQFVRALCGPLCKDSVSMIGRSLVQIHYWAAGQGPKLLNVLMS